MKFSVHRLRAHILRAAALSIVVVMGAGAHSALAASPTTTSITSNLNPGNEGDPVTFTATIVPAAGGAPGGTVTFKDGGTPLDSGTIAVTPWGVQRTMSAGVNGGHTCAIDSGGAVQCWGYNGSGQLGDGSQTEHSTPTTVSGLGAGSGVKSVVSGSSHTCVITAGDGVKCWGLNDAGQSGPAADTSTPQDVPGVSGVIQLALGTDHTCALLSTGGVKCWGANGFGQLGNSSVSSGGTTSTPVDVTGLTGVTFIAAAVSSTCAILSDATVKCWGRNHYGQLGNNPPSTNGTDDANDSVAPVAVSGLTGVTHMSGGVYFFCAVASGTAECWGASMHATLGNGTSSTTGSGVPVSTGITNAAVVAAGQYHACASTTDGGAKCWGWEINGRLGDANNSSNNLTPTDVSGLGSGAGVTNISTGNDFSCAQFIDGSVQCWGRDFFGQLGDGAAHGADDKWIPTGVQNLGSGGTRVLVTAQFTTGDLVAGTHTITATYNGDANFTTSTSSGLSQVVNSTAKPPTTTTITDNTPNPSYFGQRVVVTVTVTADSGTPTGKVTLKVGSTSYGTGMLAAGTVTIHTNDLPFGNNMLKAVYTGDSTFARSTSATVAQSVQNRTSTQLKAIAAADGSITLTATVAIVAPGSGTPTGNVKFSHDDGRTPTNLGNKALSGGVATLHLPVQKFGSYTFRADYVGTTINSPSLDRAGATIEPNQGATLRPNSKSVADHETPSVARLPGGFVAVWQANNQDGDAGGIYGQRYTTAFAKQGSEFKINTTTTFQGDQSEPRVAVLADGGFLVVWTSTGQDGDGGGIYAQRYKPNGTKSRAEFRVNTRVISQQYAPAVAGLEAGGFVVVWTSLGGDSDGLGVVGQIYDQNSATVGNEFLINGTVAGDQEFPAVAGLLAADGGFVVTWRSAKSDHTGFDIMAKRYDHGGSVLKGQFRINTNTNGDRYSPVIAPTVDGGYVIVWAATPQDGAGLGVYEQRYNSSNGKAGGETRVNTTVSGDQFLPAVSAFGGGGFAVLWKQEGASGANDGIYGQAFKANGAKADTEFRLAQTNPSTPKPLRNPAVAAFDDGTAVGVWTMGQPSAGDIAAQKFFVPGVN